MFYFEIRAKILIRNLKIFNEGQLNSIFNLYTLKYRDALLITGCLLVPGIIIFKNHVYRTTITRNLFR